MCFPSHFLWSWFETFQSVSIPTSLCASRFWLCLPEEVPKFHENNGPHGIFGLTRSRKNRKRYFKKSRFSHCWCLESWDKLWVYFQIFGCPSNRALNGVWNIACWGGIGQWSRWDRIGSRAFLHLVSRMMEVKLEVSHPNALSRRQLCEYWPKMLLFFLVNIILWVVEF